MMLQKLDAYTKLIANLADKPNLSASDLKAYFDNSPEEIRVAFNNLIDALKAITDGDSGADNIGATAIAGLDGATVQALLEALKAQIDNVTLGQIPDGSITKQKLAFNAADQDILSSQVTNEGASLIGIEDASAHFTSTNVEGALSELFQFANDGKTNIATVVGSPATTSDTFSQLQTHIQDAKNSMATNLTNKGQSSTGTEALQALADKIANVNTGKKWASGTSTSDSSSILTVSGLDFTPTTIVCYYTTYDRAIYDTNYSTNSSYYSNSSSTAVQVFSGFGGYVNGTGFKIKVNSPSTSYKWKAYE